MRSSDSGGSNQHIPGNQSGRLTKALDGQEHAPTIERPVIGILPGEGIGPEVIKITTKLLDLIANHWSLKFDFRIGGPIGIDAETIHGKALSDEVTEFCDSIFQDSGVVLCGPGGGRFVYELRAHFDLFCKFTPVKSMPCLQDTGVVKSHALENTDIIIVRENVGGLYFSDSKKTEKEVIHSFQYDNEHIRRILEVAIRLAHQRQGKLMLTVKSAAVREISTLWVELFNQLSKGEGLDTCVLEIDNAAYQIISAAQSFDVIVSPNMFGDILSDVSALLLGSRGMSFSGNFSQANAAVYQTAHGAAHDLAGKDIANPIGQILSATMMLRESFGLFDAAEAIEMAVRQTLSSGIRTQDIASDTSTIVGTQAMGQHIANFLEKSLSRHSAAT